MATSNHDVPVTGSSHASSRCFRHSVRAAGTPGAKRRAGGACVHAGVWLKPIGQLPHLLLLCLRCAARRCLRQGTARPIAAAGPIPSHGGLALESLKTKPKPLCTPRRTITGTVQAPAPRGAFKPGHAAPRRGSLEKVAFRWGELVLAPASGPWPL